MSRIPPNANEDINLLITYFGIGIEALAKTSDKIRSLSARKFNSRIDQFGTQRQANIRKSMENFEKKFSKLNERKFKKYIEDLKPNNESSRNEEERRELEPINRIKSEPSEEISEEMAIPEYCSEYSFLEERNVENVIGNEGGVKRQHSPREEMKFRVPLETESKMISKPEIVEMDMREGVDLSESQEGIDLSAEFLTERIEENSHREELEKITPKDSVVMNTDKLVKKETSKNRNDGD